jgi:predicted nucleic acid-binding protein
LSLIPKLRSLDAIHLATAAFLGSALIALVTYDARLSWRRSPWA